MKLILSVVAIAEGTHALAPVVRIGIMSGSVYREHNCTVGDSMVLELPPVSSPCPDVDRCTQQGPMHDAIEAVLTAEGIIDFSDALQELKRLFYLTEKEGPHADSGEGHPSEQEPAEG